MLSLPVALDSRYGVLLVRYAMTTRDDVAQQEARGILEEVQRESRQLVVAPLDPLFYLGLIYRQARMADETLAVFTQIEKTDPTYPGVFMILVDLKYSPELLRGMLPGDLEQLRLEPDNPERLLRVAVEAYYAGETELSKTTFGKILELSPDSADANHYLGRIFFDAGDYASAQPLLLHAVEKTATPVADYVLYLGWLHEMQGSYADASEQLTELEGKVNAYKATKLSAFLEQCADRVQIRDNLKQVKERSVTTTESLEEKQYTVQLSRVTVEQFANFLYEAETTGFPMIIKSTKVKTTLAAGQKLLEVTFEISAYRLIEEEQEATG